MPQGLGQVRPEDIQRISAEQARAEVEAGRALLVCGYEDEAKCRQMRLENSVSLQELQRGLDCVPRNQALIFYCA